MTENLRKLAESFAEAAPDGALASEILKNAVEIKHALATTGEYVLTDGNGNEYHLKAKNGTETAAK